MTIVQTNIIFFLRVKVAIHYGLRLKQNLGISSSSKVSQIGIFVKHDRFIQRCRRGVENGTSGFLQ